MADLVRRSDVLALAKDVTLKNGAKHRCIDATLVHEIPSAQPELDEWCTDCKEYDQERHCCPRWNRVIRQTLKDAELERKKGRWQITDAYPHNVYCSECHIKFAQKHWAVWEDGSLPRNFCPNCGAEMTEGENE